MISNRAEQPGGDRHGHRRQGAGRRCVAPSRNQGKHARTEVPGSRPLFEKLERVGRHPGVGVPGILTGRMMGPSARCGPGGRIGNRNGFGTTSYLAICRVGGGGFVTGGCGRSSGNQPVAVRDAEPANRKRARCGLGYGIAGNGSGVLTSRALAFCANSGLRKDGELPREAWSSDSRFIRS